ncbi:Membralin, partial [Schistosoma japonicum]
DILRMFETNTPFRIPVAPFMTVILALVDPESNPCFGSKLSRFLMEEFLGYDDILISSVKYLLAGEELNGYLVNVISGQHYKLVMSQMSRSCYFSAGLIMLLFKYVGAKCGYIKKAKSLVSVNS